MWDLRWVLIGLGALVLVGVYLWSRGLVRRDMLPALPRRKQRTEPTLDGPEAAVAPDEPPSLVETVSEEEKKAPERIVALRLVPRADELPTERAAAGGALVAYAPSDPRVVDEEIQALGTRLQALDLSFDTIDEAWQERAKVLPQVTLNGKQENWKKGFKVTLEPDQTLELNVDVDVSVFQK